MSKFDIPEKRIGLNEVQKNFLEQRYLKEKYPMPEEFESTFRSVAEELDEKFPKSFNSFTVVGGIANGSFAFRKLTEKNPATDLDFYLVGYERGEKQLADMSSALRVAVARLGLIPDAALNGKNPDNFLDLAQINRHIDAEDFDLLALPFGCSFGNTKEAQLAVLNGVKKNPSKDKIWEKIKDYHNQGLSMHHGKWGNNINKLVLDNYLPKKVEIFGLPDKPEDFKL
jgi:hypothetical protein